MDNDRLLMEAQLIATKFSFWMVKGKIDHLYGYIYESPDGKTKYALEILYNETFPEKAPDFSFPQEIPNLAGDIELNSISEWTSKSHVIDIVSELAKIVKIAIEGKVEPQEFEKIPEVQIDSNNDEQSKNDEEIVIVNESEIDETSEEYITPSMDEYQYDSEEPVSNPNDLPVWGEEEEIKVEEIQDNNVNELSSENIQSENNTSDANIDVTTESALIQQEYAMDYIDNFVGKVEIYLTITIEQTFIIKIDFSEFPKRPIIELPEGLSSLFGDINSALDVLRKWNEKKPSHVVEIIRELEGKLWFLSDIDGESKRIAGEYKTELIGGIISNLKVTLLTYGFKEYQVEIDISKYPDPPTIIYSSELNDLIKSPVENLNSFKKWKRKESHAVELLEEISWLVDKNSRINFELALMKGGMKDVSYNESLNIISAVLKGEMKTKDLTFKFEVKLSNDYPVSAPIIKLKSELESMEDIKEKLTTQINTFTSSWHQFNYLIDLFNQISKAIFEVSVISCVICHQIECLACKKKISAPDKNDQCQVVCPHCERLYHKCCWDQTILSFKKCGFCLRPPPPNMMPNI